MLLNTSTVPAVNGRSGSSARRFWNYYTLVDSRKLITFHGRLPAPLKLERADVAEGRMKPLAVIKHLDVVEDRQSLFGTGRPVLLVEEFSLA